MWWPARSTPTLRHRTSLIVFLSTDLETCVQGLRNKTCKISTAPATTNPIQRPSQEVADSSHDPLPAIMLQAKIGKRSSMETRKVVRSNRSPQGTLIDAVSSRAIPRPAEPRKTASKEAGFVATEVTVPLGLGLHGSRTGFSEWRLSGNSYM